MSALISAPFPGARRGLFVKYRLSGKTYQTASGTLVPDELQYYDGEMLHLYGECAHVSRVNDALAGSGYKALTLHYGDGRQAAVAQVWASRFTQTTIGPYDAMFLVAVVVPDSAPPQQASLKADANGASCVLTMLDGTFDSATGVYENRARLFLVRLLDSTQVAIDVGRERMGTDKRPGRIALTRDSGRLRVSISDQHGRGVISGALDLATDRADYLADVTQAAGTAGVTLPPLPSATEYAYPVVARIGRGTVVSWHWRSDAVPQLQRVDPGAVRIDSSSEEGRLLSEWGFTPRALGYIPSVRGVVTGLSTTGATSPRLVAPTVPLLRAAPGDSDTASVLPILQLVRASAGNVHGNDHAAPPAAISKPAAHAPRWKWDTTFLGSLTALLRKEVVGATPDGLRINWHVTEGTFAGPGLDARVLPGAADWMRIRQDGIAIVNVQACFETREGVRVNGSYGGVFDLGPNGYARALRDEYDELPPVVVTPTYATADPRLEWLNRAQCIGVGRVDMAALRVEFDVYVVRVGPRQGPTTAAPGPRVSGAPAHPDNLYARLGGYDVIAAVTDDFLVWSYADPRLSRFFGGGHSRASLEASRQHVVNLLCQLTGGPCVYTGRDMRTAHAGLGVTDVDWDVAWEWLTKALRQHDVDPRAQQDFLDIVQRMKGLVVETRR